MWRASAPDPADVKRLRAAREKYSLAPLAIHVNYLINLATLDPIIREKSIVAFRGELDRAAAIGAEYLVLHPGNYKDQSLEEGIAALALGLAEAAHEFRRRPDGADREYGRMRNADRQPVRGTAVDSRAGGG